MVDGEMDEGEEAEGADRVPSEENGSSPGAEAPFYLLSGIKTFS